MRCHLLALAVAAAWLTPAPAQTPEQKQETVDYLRSLQVAGSGFLPSRDTDNAKGKVLADVRATSSSLRALKYFGGEARDRAAAARFVASCFDKAKGGFASRPGGTPDVTTTAVGAMAAVELKLPADDYAAAVVKYLSDNARSFNEIRIAVAGLEALGKTTPKAEAWLRQLRAMKKPDGSYDDTDDPGRGTGGVVVAMLRLGARAEDRERVLEILRANQRRDGGYGTSGADASDLEATYRVMRCYHMLKAKPANESALRGYVARCRNADGGYGVSPGAASSASGTYFAGIILHWLDEK